MKKTTLGLGLALLFLGSFWQLAGHPAKKRRAEAAAEAVIVTCQTGAYRVEYDRRKVEAEIAFRQLPADEALQYSLGLHNQLIQNGCERY